MRICRAATKIVHPWHLSTYTEPLTGPQSTVQFVSSSSRNAPKLSHLRSLRVTSREREWPRGSNSQGDGAAIELLKVEIRRAPVHGGHGAGGARQRAVCAAAKPRLSQNRRRRHWRRRSGRWPRDVCGGSRRRRRGRRRLGGRALFRGLLLPAAERKLLARYKSSLGRVNLRAQLVDLLENSRGAQRSSAPNVWARERER